MAGAAAFDLARGDLQRGFLYANREALAFGARYPLFHRIGLGRAELGRRSERGEPVGKFADDLLQRALLDLEVALRRDFLAGGKVEACLRLVRVGDGGGAHLEIAFGLRQLLGNGGLLRLDERQAVLRGEYVEISLGYAHDQVLRHLSEGGFGLCHFIAGFPV